MVRIFRLKSGAQLGQTACTHPAAPAGAHMRTGYGRFSRLLDTTLVEKIGQ